MAKNIVICCDGTGNEFSDRNSNVVKVYQMLVLDPTQVAYYHPGVGTMGARSALSPIGKAWTKLIGYAFGYGASDNVADAYQFLMRNFKPGDQIYVFGFSRGAYTARVLCGLLHMVGLLREDNEGLIPYAIRLMKTKPLTGDVFKIAGKFKDTFSRPCKPHFVGVWDTVSSMGWIYNAVKFPFTTATSNPDLNIVRHAVSIDERRAFFRQNLFGPPSDKNPNQSVEEVWFFVGGRGRMWRRFDGEEVTVDVFAGVSIAIPAGAAFQFRADGDEPLRIVGVTMPPWPGETEAYPVDGVWPPTIKTGSQPE